MKPTDRVLQWLLRIIQLQLFISVISLPILISWGLPISVMTPVANILFGPLLTIFLLLASLIFFLQLAHIPHGIFVLCLEYTTHLWSHIMHLGSKTWLIGFAKPSAWFFCVIVILSFAILHFKKFNTAGKRSLGLFILLVCTTGYLKFISASCSPILNIPCNNGSISILHTNNTTVFLDPGWLGKKAHMESWMEYTLLPELIKQYGTSIIDHCIILQPRSSTLHALNHLCTIATVRTIYLPFWDGIADKSLLRAYGLLQHTIKKQKISLIRLGNSMSIPLAHGYITFLIQERQITHNAISFPHIKTNIELDKKAFCFSSAIH